jgi:hypothetical protein
MSISDTEKFIKDKLKLLNRYMDTPETALPVCTQEELWAKPAIFSYYKNPSKLDRSTKNFDSYWEANQKLVEDGSVGIIKERKGEIIFCKYCNAKGICSQAKAYAEEGRLVV